MTIYRSRDGQQAIRAWCEGRLASWERPHRTSVIPSMLGSTHVLITGDGPDVVLLPGTNFPSASWLDLVAALAVDHRVFALDLPGQPGLSSDERPAKVGEKYGRWLIDAIASLGVDHPVVVAHSLGAVVGLRAAVERRALSRLVLLDPAGFTRLRVTFDVVKRSLSWVRDPSDARSAALLSMMLAPGHSPEPDLVNWMSLVGRHVRTSLAPRPLRPEEFRALRAMPVEVLSGRHDVFLPPARLAKAVRRQLPTAGFRIVEAAGHLLPHEQPDAVVRAVREP